MAGDGDLNSRLRALPSVDRVAAVLEGPAGAVAGASRHAIDQARAEIRSGAAAPAFEQIVSAARALLSERQHTLLQPVINATGVLIHTNLGRVPLGAEQLAAVTEVASGYSNLEYDLGSGGRGDRYQHATRLISELTGAEAALVVNNNAAAVLLSLAALCAGKEVIISRGELVEIGGEFRIPDVMKAAGVKLVEVGATNRTHLADYEKAISVDTAAILKVHPSNYRVVGFTAEVSPREVARLALGRALCFIHDLGSGFVLESDLGPSLPEPLVRDALDDGADIVTFSGDKLLGGPQAGVIAGRVRLIEKISKHPMLRAVRPDKMTLAALEATLRIYLEGRAAELPLWAMASAALDDVEGRARELAAKLAEELGPSMKAEAVALRSVAGGGSLPGLELPSFGVWVAHEDRSAAELQRALRYGPVAIIARVQDDRIVLDLRTIDPADDGKVLDLLVEALKA